MTRDERLLLAEISRWRRKGGWVRTYFGGYQSPDRRVEVYIPDCDDAAENEDWGRHVSAYRRPADVRVRLDVDHDAASVTEAVNLLCALGILPSRFSTQYRDGYERGHADGWRAGMEFAGHFDHNRIAVDLEVSDAG